MKSGIAGVDGLSLIDAPAGSLSSPWFLMIRLDAARLHCDSDGFAAALDQEGIEGVHAGYPFFPTDHPWHRDAVVFGGTGLPWSIHSPSGPARYELPNAHQASRDIVRVDVHEFLGAREARDLVAALSKVARYMNKS